MPIDIIWDIMHREIRIYVYDDDKERRYFLGEYATLGL